MTTEAQSEETPLLSRRNHEAKIPGDTGGKRPNLLANVFCVENRILIAGFLITLAFSYTQVPLFYVFHIMTCESYYDSHPPYTGSADRCSVDAITAGTAAQFTILGMSTTICGTVNLFITGHLVKKFGPRAALILQTVVPAVRVLAQVVGVMAGKETGMIIIQSTQLITVLGGPVGYILVVNIIAGQVVTPARRTAVFGKLQGAIMLGQGIGFLVGGMIGDAVDIRAPFDVACVSFLFCALYTRLAIPYIPPDAADAAAKAPDQGALASFLAPLRILAPQRLHLRDGRMRKHYGVAFLCCGIFLGVLATGYVPLLIQQWATADFGFTQADNGYLMAEFAFVRGLFLMLLFPHIISWGRRLLARRATLSEDDLQAGYEAVDGAAGSEENAPLLSPPTDVGRFDMPSGEQVDQEPLEPVRLEEDEEGSPAFDLVFLRWSLVLDGVLTAGAAFCTEWWHIYLAAALLPFASGSAPAAKGVITQMTPDSARSDALNAVTLVENLARLATQGFFGFVFAALASAGKEYATFFCNAAVALLAMAVLLLSGFPEEGSTIVERDPGEGEDARG